MTTVDDYATDAEAERDIFGDLAPPQIPLEDAALAAVPRPPERRRTPGPPPNPNSKRQQKLKASAQRSRTMPTPPRKATPNTTAKAKTDITETYQRGALAVIGWVARPLAASAMAMNVAANLPNANPAKAATMSRHAMALTLDSLTLSVHAEPLAEGMAAAAEQLPWMAQVLEKAAKISPFASLLETGVTIVFQVLANHGIMAASPELGTLAPPELAERAGLPFPEAAPVG